MIERNKRSLHLATSSKLNYQGATGSEVVATGTGCQLRGPSLLFQEGQYGAFTFVTSRLEPQKRAKQCNARTYQAAEVALWFA